jgi:hypothetical protein
MMSMLLMVARVAVQVVAHSELQLVVMALLGKVLTEVIRQLVVATPELAAVAQVLMEKIYSPITIRGVVVMVCFLVLLGLV